MLRPIALACTSALVAALLTWALSRPQQSIQPIETSHDFVTEGDQPIAAEQWRASHKGAPSLEVHSTAQRGALQGAKVEVYERTAGDWVARGLEQTDAKGRASFFAPPGRYVIRAEHPEVGVAVRIIDLPHATQPFIVELALDQHRAVRGQVIDKHTRAPVSGARVSWLPVSDERPLPSSFALTTISDAFGRFSIEVPLDVQGALEAKSPLYALTRDWCDTCETPVDIEMERVAFIDGQVVNQAGAPVVSATVRAEPSEQPPVLTDDEGRFMISVHPGGSTVLAVSPRGPQALSRFSLEPGATQRDVRLVLAEGSSLEGVVVDEHNQGVAAARVRIYSEPDGLEVADLTTSAQGGFAAFQLPPGRYTVDASATGLSSGQQVSVEPPTTEPLTITLRPRSRLDGTVYNQAGLPLGNVLVSVTLAMQQGAVVGTARSDDDGHFEIDGLPSARLDVIGRITGAAEGTTSLYLGAGESTHVDLTIVAMSKVEGHVSNATSNTQVFLVSTSTHRAYEKPLTLDANGRFSVVAAAGRYMVLASESHGEAIASHDVVLEPDATTQVELTLELNAAHAEAPPRRVTASNGVSFDNGPGGVTIGFLNSECDVAKAGARSGDLVISIDGAPVRDSLDAFARVKNVTELTLVIRRDGVDRTIVVK